MIDVQIYIDRLDFLREVLDCWIDYWMGVPVLKERYLAPLPQLHFYDMADGSIHQL